MRRHSREKENVRQQACPMPPHFEPPMTSASPISEALACEVAASRSKPTRTRIKGVATAMSTDCVVIPPTEGSSGRGTASAAAKSIGRHQQQQVKVRTKK